MGPGTLSDLLHSDFVKAVGPGFATCLSLNPWTSAVPVSHFDNGGIWHSLSEEGVSPVHSSFAIEPPQ